MSKILDKLDDTLRLKDGSVNTQVLLIGIIVQFYYVIILLRNSIDLIETIVLCALSVLSVILQSPILIVCMVPYHLYKLVKGSKPLVDIIANAKSNCMAIICSGIIVLEFFVCAFMLGPTRMEDLVLFAATLVLLVIAAD